MTITREYNVPLRSGWLKVPKHKRAQKAVSTLREFISKHMKSDTVKVGRYVNLEIWKDGIKNPPHHVKVNAKKDDDGVVHVSLFGAPSEETVPAVEEKGKDGKGSDKDAPTDTKAASKEADVSDEKESKKPSKSEQAADDLAKELEGDDAPKAKDIKVTKADESDVKDALGGKN